MTDNNQIKSHNSKPWYEYSTKASPKQTTRRRNQEAEEAALKVLDDFMTYFNAKDLSSMKNTFNVPSYRLVKNPPRMIEIDQKRLDKQFSANPKNLRYLIEVEGWDHSCWDRRHVIWSQEDKVHFDCCFTRYRLDGSIIGTYESIYIVTKDENNHWGIKLRSTSADQTNQTMSKL